MFDTVARRYDLTNDVLTAGIHRSWRRAVFDAVGERARSGRILDLAAGTGFSSLLLARAGAYVVPCDFSLGMLQVGRQGHPELPFVAGDATQLPFRDDAFDAVTISYGLRNVMDPIAGLREMLRVTRPGGVLVVCEFSHPTNVALRTAYLQGVMRLLPTLARAVASAPDAYVYLAESIRAWPNQPALAGVIGASGWQQVQWRDLTGGIAAVHRAVKPEQ